MFAGLVLEVEGPLGLDSWAAIFVGLVVVVAANGLLECDYFRPIAQRLGKINHGSCIWYLSGRVPTLWLDTASKDIYLRPVGSSLPSFLQKLRFGPRARR